MPKLARRTQLCDQEKLVMPSAAWLVLGARDTGRYRMKLASQASHAYL